MQIHGTTVVPAANTTLSRQSCRARELGAAWRHPLRATTIAFGLIGAMGAAPHRAWNGKTVVASGGATELCQGRTESSLVLLREA